MCKLAYWLDKCAIVFKLSEGYVVDYGQHVQIGILVGISEGCFLNLNLNLDFKLEGYVATLRTSQL